MCSRKRPMRTRKDYARPPVSLPSSPRQTLARRAAVAPSIPPHVPIESVVALPCDSVSIFKAHAVYFQSTIEVVCNPGAKEIC